jgi:hypothetical protein
MWWSPGPEGSAFAISAPQAAGVCARLSGIADEGTHSPATPISQPEGPVTADGLATYDGRL